MTDATYPDVLVWRVFHGDGALHRYACFVALDGETRCHFEIAAPDRDTAIRRVRAFGQAMVEAVDAGTVEELPF
jgi:hypothetical protein